MFADLHLAKRFFT